MPWFFGLAGNSFNDVLELPGLVEFGEMFADWLRGLSTFWNALNVPIGELLTPFDSGLGFGSVLETCLDKTGLGDLTLLMIILGGSLMFYVVYQLLSWLFDIIT